MATRTFESNSYDPSALCLNYDALQEQSARKDKELKRLRALLAANDIPWMPAPQAGALATCNGKATSKSSTSGRALRNRNRRARVNSKLPGRPQRPHLRLPIENIFMIVGYGLTSPTPIIDPFFHLCKDNIIKAERKTNGRHDINIGFLATCRAFKAEGTPLLVRNNDFIFTQVAALQNFARIPLKSRSIISKINIRVVGRYYDREPRILDLEVPHA
jgi:hypothetical protein